jgi:hypothetical protein
MSTFNPDAAEFTPRSRRERELEDLSTNLDNAVFEAEANNSNQKRPPPVFQWPLTNKA